ncbi:hypothetical protein Bbelb_075430 [Branchiostoma belcheri]|nr:hypothetical protein Bbelb_075430 [Branchiostoma belcheri]
MQVWQKRPGDKRIWYKCGDVTLPAFEQSSEGRNTGAAANSQQDNVTCQAPCSTVTEEKLLPPPNPRKLTLFTGPVCYSLEECCSFSSNQNTMRLLPVLHPSTAAIWINIGAPCSGGPPKVNLQLATSERA